jgi:hypothetical protein
MNRTSVSGWLAGLLFLAAGCVGVPKTAVVDGRQVPRLTIQLAGNPYQLKHEGAHPRPGGPSSGLRDAGGSIRGRVCGMFVDLEVQHRGDHLEVVGSIDNHVPLSLSLSEANGVRRYNGNLGDLGIDFTRDAQRISGSVGRRTFVLELDGDVYKGFMKTPIARGAHFEPMPVTLTGKQALEQMPAADEAVVLPTILTCQSAGGQYRAVGALDLGFGGPEKDRPDETSAIYTHSR